MHHVDLFNRLVGFLTFITDFVSDKPTMGTNQLLEKLYLKLRVKHEWSNLILTMGNLKQYNSELEK